MLSSSHPNIQIHRPVLQNQSKEALAKLKENVLLHKTGLTKSLLKHFAPREMPPYFPRQRKKAQKQSYTGVSGLIDFFEDPNSEETEKKHKQRPEKRKFNNLEFPVQAYVEAESKREKRERLAQTKIKQAEQDIEEGLKHWDPSKDPNIEGDPYKTLFVSRISYEVSERKLKKEFERYGPIKRVRMVYDKVNTDKSGKPKPRGYAFIEYEHKQDMREAYKRGDGAKLEGRRVLVDAERGRTVDTWRPRRLGGGKGGESRKTVEKIRTDEQSEYLNIIPETIITTLKPDGRRPGEKDRDRDRDRERSNRDKSHHDKLREKSKDQEKDKDRNREKEKEKEKEKDRERRKEKDKRGDREKDRRGDREKDKSKDVKVEREKDREIKMDRNDSKRNKDEAYEEGITKNENMDVDKDQIDIEGIKNGQTDEKLDMDRDKNRDKKREERHRDRVDKRDRNDKEKKERKDKHKDREKDREGVRHRSNDRNREDVAKDRNYERKYDNYEQAERQQQQENYEQDQEEFYANVKTEQQFSYEQDNNFQEGFEGDANANGNGNNNLKENPNDELEQYDYERRNGDEQERRGRRESRKRGRPEKMQQNDWEEGEVEEDERLAKKEREV